MYDTVLMINAIIVFCIPREQKNISVFVDVGNLNFNYSRVSKYKCSVLQ